MKPLTIEQLKALEVGDIYDTDGVAFDKQVIGKSIYLSKEEAKAHLRELQEQKYV